ncbi:MAG: glycosyltransferase [Synechococcus sp.]
MKRFFSPKSVLKRGKAYLKNRWRKWKEHEAHQGKLELVENSCLLGWVFDSANPNRSVEYILWVDGKQFGRDIAAWPRSTPPHKAGIQFPLSEEILDGKRHSFQLEIAPSGIRFPRNPVLLRTNSPSPSVETDARGHRFPGVLGGIEHVGAGGAVTGWLFDPARPNTSLSLCLLVDGKEVGWTLACLYREDLLSFNIGDGRKGFHFTIPSYLQDGREHELQVRILGSNQCLLNQPITKIISSTSIEDEIERYFGFIQLQGDRLVGEVGDRLQPNLPVPIEIVLNNRARAFITPSIARDGSERTLLHCFDEPVSRFLSEGERLHSAAFRIAGTDKYFIDAHSPAAFLASHGQATRDDSQKPRLTIIAWDATHNPLGRAYILAEMMRHDFEVEIIAPMFPQYGTDIWEPLRQAPIPIRTFWGRPFPEHFEDLSTIAASIETDYVWVSKPRLPSLELGFLVKERLGCPLIVDVDDLELSFFPDERQCTLEDLEQARIETSTEFFKPYGHYWTALCQSLLDEADLVTTSNHTLQSRFGGIIVPHIRDETVFDPALYDRDRLRKEMGYSPDDRVVLFLGTPRLHKGFGRVLEALEAIGNPQYSLLLVGTITDTKTRQLIDKCDQRYLKKRPNCSFQELSGLVACADLVCILQDPRSRISAYQMPAKFTDALAMCVPVLATSVPPLEPLIDAGLIISAQMDNLDAQLGQILDNIIDYREQAKQARATFLDNFSYQAVSSQLGPTLLKLQGKSRTLGEAGASLLDYHRQHFPYTSSPVHADSHQPIDIVFFWKQFDSGIYGRRPDMIVKYLAQDSRVRRIVHFEPPISKRQLSVFESDSLGQLSQARFVYDNVISRNRCERDSEKILRRTLIVEEPSGNSGLSTSQAYVEFVKQTLQDADVDAGNSVFWFCPKNVWFQSLVDSLRPRLVVSDIIDDHRKWAQLLQRELDVSKNYAQILTRSHLTFTNCEENQSAFGALAGSIHVVPNGLELPEARDESLPDPPELESIPRPRIGYIGNLDAQRLDMELMEYLISNRPEWQLVLVGSLHANQSALALDRFPNVHFLGVRPYSQARNLAKAFDVGIIPHRDTSLTRSMNPLKAYFYLAAGLPIVSTPVANLPPELPTIAIASDPGQFVAAIEQTLDAPARLSEQERSVLDDFLHASSWERRVNTMIEELQKKLSNPAYDIVR